MATPRTSRPLSITSRRRTIATTTTLLSLLLCYCVIPDVDCFVNAFTITTTTRSFPSRHQNTKHTYNSPILASPITTSSSQLNYSKLPFFLPFSDDSHSSRRNIRNRRRRNGLSQQLNQQSGNSNNIIGGSSSPGQRQQNRLRIL